MQPPLFILAPPRSFSSVTCAMIGCHPQMFGLAETHLFVSNPLTRFARLSATRPWSDNGLLRSVSELCFGEQTEDNIEAIRTWLRENPDMNSADLFRMMGEWAGDRSLIEKSPAYAYMPGALRRMHEHFPDAFFLHLIRHPVPMWRSYEKLYEKLSGVQKVNRLSTSRLENRRFRRDRSPDNVWLRAHQTILAFLKEIPADRQMRVRGEDLMSAPPEYLARICRWLGKRDDAAAIEAMLHPETSPFARWGPPNAPLGFDVNFLENPTLRPFSAKKDSFDELRSDSGSTIFSAGVKAYAEMFGY